MSLHLGDTNIAEVYVGENKIKEIYLGEQLVYSSNTDDLVVIRNGALTEEAAAAGFTLSVTSGKPEASVSTAGTYNISNTESGDDITHMEYGNVKFTLTVPTAYQDNYFVHAVQDTTEFPSSGTIESGGGAWSYVKEINNDNYEKITTLSAVLPIFNVYTVQQYGKYIYCFSSFSGNSIYKYDTKNGTFHEIIGNPLPNIYTTAKYGNIIYIFEYTSSQADSHVYRFNPGNNTMIGSSGISIRAIAACATVGNKIYCFAGRGNANIAVQIFDIETETMEWLSEKNPESIDKAITVGNIIYCFTNNGYWKFDTTTNTFSTTRKSVAGYTSESIPILKDSSIYVFPNQFANRPICKIDIDTDTSTALGVVIPDSDVITCAEIVDDSIYCFGYSNTKPIYKFDIKKSTISSSLIKDTNSTLINWPMNSSPLIKKDETSTEVIKSSTLTWENKACCEITPNGYFELVSNDAIASYSLFNLYTDSSGNPYIYAYTPSSFSEYPILKYNPLNKTVTSTSTQLYYYSPGYYASVTVGNIIYYFHGTYSYVSKYDILSDTATLLTGAVTPVQNIYSAIYVESKNIIYCFSYDQGKNVYRFDISTETFSNTNVSIPLYISKAILYENDIYCFPTSCGSVLYKFNVETETFTSLNVSIPTTEFSTISTIKHLALVDNKIYVFIMERQYSGVYEYNISNNTFTVSIGWGVKKKIYSGFSINNTKDGIYVCGMTNGNSQMDRYVIQDLSPKISVTEKIKFNLSLKKRYISSC